MQTNKMAVQKIQRIGSRTIADDMLYKSIYKSLGVKGRVSKKINPDYIRNHLLEKEVIYHPFWIVKNLIIAERPPFPSKKLPNVIFIDAVSGYRGLFSKIPPITDEKVGVHALATLRISMEEEVTKYIKSVQEKQINRSYILKKPKHEVKEVSLVYLPIWKARVKSDELDETFYINGNTGESEKFMSARWKSGKDLLK